MDKLRRPLRGLPPITQVWGPTSNPFEPPAFGAAHFHLGVDYGVPCGTPVYAPDEGVIEWAGWDYTGFGCLLTIAHPNGLRSSLGHLSRYKVGEGQHVLRGELVALSGTTGNSTGCHLHFGVRRGTLWVPPAPEMDLTAW